MTPELDVIERGSPLVVVRRPIEQANIILGVAGMAAADDRAARTMTVLNSILGGGMSSRLFQEIREKRGLAYSVYSFAPSYSDAGLFGHLRGVHAGQGCRRSPSSCSASSRGSARAASRTRSSNAPSGS